MRIVALLFLMAVLALAAARAEDKVYLRSGEVRSGVVTGADTDVLQFQKVTQYGRVGAPIPLADVERVELEATPAIEKFLEKADHHSRARVVALWEKRRRFLPVPDSRAAQIGLAAARKLQESGTPADLASAIRILETIEAHSRDPKGKSDAFDLRLQVLVASGRTDEARQEAEAGLESEDRERRAVSAYLLALALIADYNKLIEENPRWEMDPQVKPECERLYNRIFDLLFIPYLENGMPAEPAARSLWEISKFHDSNGDTVLAVDTAQDIVVIYPRTSYRKLASDYIAQHTSTDE